MPERLLNIENLNAHYGDFQALFNVSAHVEHSEVIAIIGANGAGKSTLLRSVTGLIQGRDSEIVFKGKSIGAARADKVARLGIAMVPEGRQLFPSLSVEENLKLGATVKRTGKWTLAAIYKLFPILEEKKHLGAMSLSGGQQQMAAIARALMSNPDLILFDEISLGLAPVVIDDVYAAIPEIVKEGVAAVIVEQDISRALSVASRVYCLQEGRVKLHGRADALSRDEITQAYFGVAA